MLLSGPQRAGGRDTLVRRSAPKGGPPVRTGDPRRPAAAAGGGEEILLLAGGNGRYEYLNSCIFKRIYTTSNTIPLTSQDVFLLELHAGRPRLLLGLGGYSPVLLGGEGRGRRSEGPSRGKGRVGRKQREKLPPRGSLADGNWHRIDVFWGDEVNLPYEHHYTLRIAERRQTFFPSSFPNTGSSSVRPASAWWWTSAWAKTRTAS